MELTLNRKTRSNISTIRELRIDGNFECFVLEDHDCILKQSMSLSELNNLKVHAQTCIPEGRYEIAITFTEKFGKSLPLPLDVSCYAGIRIRPAMHQRIRKAVYCRAKRKTPMSQAKAGLHSTHSFPN